MTTGTFRFILLFILLLIPTAASGERTALHEAAERSQADEVTRLLEAGADVEARDNFGRTALYGAASKGDLGIVKVLLEHGADAEARAMMGRTPRDLATRQAVIRLLDQATRKETP